MKLITLTVFILLLPLSSGAVTVFECVDSEGNRSFYDRCPPGTSPVDEKKYRGDQKPEEPTVTLYTIPDCDTCIKVMNYLQARNIDYENKNLKGNTEVQKELNDMVGELRVPTVVINEAVITGYDESAMNKALKIN